MTVRLANSADKNSVEHLLKDLLTQGFDHTDFATAFASIIDSEDRTIILVEEDSKEVVGIAVVNIVQKLQHREARIDEVVVSRQSRGKGYGTMLMQACDDWAFSHGAKVIEFTSRPSRVAANALYQKLGYSIRETNVYQRKRD